MAGSLEQLSVKFKIKVTGSERFGHHKRRGKTAAKLRRSRLFKANRKTPSKMAKWKGKDKILHQTVISILKKQKGQCYRGVRKLQWGKWAAQMRDPSVRPRRWLGTFNYAKAAAALAYAFAAKKMMGSGARCNFPFLSEEDKLYLKKYFGINGIELIRDIDSSLLKETNHTDTSSQNPNHDLPTEIQESVQDNKEELKQHICLELVENKQTLNKISENLEGKSQFEYEKSCSPINDNKKISSFYLYPKNESKFTSLSNNKICNFNQLLTLPLLNEEIESCPRSPSVESHELCSKMLGSDIIPIIEYDNNDILRATGYFSDETVSNDDMELEDIKRQKVESLAIIENFKFFESLPKPWMKQTSSLPFNHYFFNTYFYD